MEHFIEFLIFGFTVFIAMNQLFDIALLLIFIVIKKLS